MKAVKRVLITLTCMVVILAAGAGVYYFINEKRKERFEEERVVRVEEITASSEEIKHEIEEISNHSQEEIKQYLDEKVYVDETDLTEEEYENLSDPWNIMTSEEISEIVENGKDASVSGNEIESTEGSVSGNEIESTEGSVSGNEIENAEGSVSGNEIESTEGSVSGNEIENAEGSVSGNEIENAEGSVSGNIIYSRDSDINMDDIVEDSVSDNNISDEEVGLSSEEEVGLSSEEEVKLTLQARQKLRTSYEETKLWIEADNETLENTQISFEGKKIACIGDSITEACTRSEPDKIPIAYPTRLKETLGALEVTNLGIGGSSIGRYWFEPFCDRYLEIPEDTDIIFVMGGTNDGFCLTEDLVGNSEDREPNTLYGDLDELMKGLKENYPNAEIVFMTPMANVTHDILRKERDYLLPQNVVVNCIMELAEDYDINVIDLYNSNFFDSHDSEVLAEYIPDGTHPNPEGYNLLARHIAAELVRIHEKEELTGAQKESEVKDSESKDSESKDSESKGSEIKDSTNGKSNEEVTSDEKSDDQESKDNKSKDNITSDSQSTDSEGKNSDSKSSDVKNSDKEESSGKKQIFERDED